MVRVLSLQLNYLSLKKINKRLCTNNLKYKDYG